MDHKCLCVRCDISVFHHCCTLATIWTWNTRIINSCNYLILISFKYLQVLCQSPILLFPWAPLRAAELWGPYPFLRLSCVKNTSFCGPCPNGTILKSFAVYEPDPWWWRVKAFDNHLKLYNVIFCCTANDRDKLSWNVS